VLIAVILAMADGFAGTRVSFDMSLKDSLLIAFFTTSGWRPMRACSSRADRNSPSSCSSALFSS